MVRINKGYIEIPVSDVIEIDGTLLQVVEDNDLIHFACRKCFFYKRKCPNVACEWVDRWDKKSVHYEVIERTGNGDITPSPEV